MGGFFQSPQSQPMIPKPVETIPGAQGLGQALINYFLPILQGTKARAPYQGYPSVYGRGTPTLNLGNMMGFQGSFPGLYTTGQPQTTAAPSGADFQTQLNEAVRSAISNANMTSAAPPPMHDTGQGSNA